MNCALSEVSLVGSPLDLISLKDKRIQVPYTLLPLILFDVCILQHMMIVVRRQSTTLGRSMRIPGRGVLGSGIRGVIPLRLRLVPYLMIVGLSSVVSSVFFLMSSSRS